MCFGMGRKGWNKCIMYRDSIPYSFAIANKKENVDKTFSYGKLLVKYLLSQLGTLNIQDLCPQ